MTIHLVTFSDESMGRAGSVCTASALVNGADNVFEWVRDPMLTKTDFYHDHKTLLDQPRGRGFWAWKPWIILEQFRVAGNGSVVVYSDAGIEFINNVSHIIERMDQDIFLFGNNWEHAHWCKASVIEVIWPIKGMVFSEARDHANWSRFGKQCQASVIFFRVSDYTRKFVAEWLKWCLIGNGELIDDSPSWFGNHPEFREHRHDQAILTTMAYREGIKLHYWPAMYNDGAFSYEKLPEYAGDDYPILFHHHRRRNHEWSNAA